MDNYIKIIKQVDFNTSKWSGGKTTQLFIYPENSNYSQRDFKFRISSATVELNESDFTKLEGVHRFITPLDGDLALTHDNETFISLKPFEIYDFDGDIPTKSYGKVQDFNLMLADGVKGDLRNIVIGEKKEINQLVNPGFNIFYSYDGVFSMRIDEEDFMLYSNELIVIKSETSRNVKIGSEKNSNVLLSSISTFI